MTLRQLINAVLSSLIGTAAAVMLLRYSKDGQDLLDTSDTHPSDP